MVLRFASGAGTTLLYIRPSDSTYREHLEQAVEIARRHADVPPAARAAAMQRLAEPYCRYDDALTLLTDGARDCGGRDARNGGRG